MNEQELKEIEDLTVCAASCPYGCGWSKEFRTFTIPKLIAEIRRLKEINEKAFGFMRDTKRTHYPTTTNSFADEFLKQHERDCDGRCKDPNTLRP